MYRVLSIGENWLGSNSRAAAQALRRLGCDVLEIDQRMYFPSVKLLTSRVVARLLRPLLIKELNNDILSLAENFQPDFLFAFKGMFVTADTLRSLRRRGISLYNFFPDTSAFTHGKMLIAALPEYDCIFHTKFFWFDDASKRLKLRAGHFLPHGYNPEVHRPIQLNARDMAEYGCDVSFIAVHSGYKEDILDRLLSLRPQLNLRIWGNGWTERCRSQRLSRCILGYGLLSERFSRAIQAAKINLAIMNGPRPGASSGDLTTSRTYAIPASGGFMLHQRNHEVLELYRENEEIACFESVEELAEKIDYFLANPEERKAIARAGHERCVPAYSYDNRMAQILRWHREHFGGGAVSIPADGVEGLPSLQERAS